MKFLLRTAFRLLMLTMLLSMFSAVSDMNIPQEESIEAEDVSVMAAAEDAQKPEAASRDLFLKTASQVLSGAWELLSDMAQAVVQLARDSGILIQPQS
ncbi:MAG: hypothetical protein IJ493_05465 [Clostridia bacterium]|nr:hypothetical protein [Clostridia bacterium]